MFTCVLYVFFVLCFLFFVLGSLFLVLCSWFFVSCSLFTIHRTPFTVHRALFTFHCLLLRCVFYTIYFFEAFWGDFEVGEVVFVEFYDGIDVEFRVIKVNDA